MNPDVSPPAWGGGLILPPAFAGVLSLGRPQTVLVPKEGTLLKYTVVALVGGAGCVGGVVLSLLVSPAPGLVPGGLGAFFVLLGLWNLARVRAAARSVVYYERGLAVQVGSNVIEWPWHELVAIVTKERWVKGKNSGYHERRYDVVSTNGQTVILIDDVFENVQGIADALKVHVKANQLPRLRAAYDAGQPVIFGPVVASKTGIQLGAHNIPWSEVANAAVKKGRLSITPKVGKPLQLSVWKIPNVELLGALIGIAPQQMELMYS